MPPKYEKLDPITHMHRRPDMYVGSTSEVVCQNTEWVCESADEISITASAHHKYIPALSRIFIEAVSNAVDNVWRSQQQNMVCKRLEVTIDREKNEFSVLNDGLVIPFLDYHPETGVRIPELIFGHLMTSTNYNDDEERLTSGRNGLGINCTNIFSTNFSVEIFDEALQQIYIQKWKNHMRQCGTPIIKAKKGKGSYVKVKWTPDLALFGVDGISKDMMSMFYKYCVDIAAITKIPVKMNGNKVVVKQYLDYVKLYPEINEFVVLSKSQEMEVVLTNATGHGHQQIVFTNGIHNRDGGAYVDTIMNEVLRLIKQALLSKKQACPLSNRELREYFQIFVNARLKNPEFNNQSKDRVMKPTPKSFPIDPKAITQVMKWKWRDALTALVERKELSQMKKTERKKVRIDGYDPANLAGTRHASKCTLILCEGLSAKTYAVTGIETGWNNLKGRDYYGIMALRGKVLNVRNASNTSISANREITNILQALNLKYKMDYSQDENFRQLDYGKVLLLTDSDNDGTHIASLVLNYFDVLFPTLLDRDFLYIMKTPIAKANKEVFYNEYEYHKFLERIQGQKKYDIKYYKGLGTSNTQEIRETFGKKVLKFNHDGLSSSTLNMVFHSKLSNDRKEWIEKFDPGVYTEYDAEYPISAFINQELIRFSIDDCRRNIPNLFDGLKTSQRKILYAVFKKNLKQSMKVAQLSGYVAEVSNYHHGEQCLLETIIRMAQSFVGSNNIPLLFPEGQFGCLSPETPILLWNGTTKAAMDIDKDDVLVGDDGLPRHILELTNGEDEMYEIRSTTTDTKFTANSQHILTLYFQNNNRIRWKKDTATWVLEYFDGTGIKVISKRTKECKGITTNHRNKSTLGKEEAYEDLLYISKEIEQLYGTDPVIDIKIVDYLKLSEANQKKLRLLHNMNVITWDKKDVPIDPYIFGVWLGDGNADGSGFTTADPEVVKEFVKWSDTIGCEVFHHDHENYHYTIRRKGSTRMNACDWYFEKSIGTADTFAHGLNSAGQKRRDLNPFKQILKHNNLLFDKHIPIEYFHNDEETRLQLLAGFIDTDGRLYKGGVNYFEITQSERLHSNLIYSLDSIAKSLGYMTSIRRYKQIHITKKGEISQSLSLRIYGNKLERIPTRLQRKQIEKQDDRTLHHPNTSQFTIHPMGVDKFYGWQIDGNERFLLGNYLVTHNSRIENGRDSASGRYIFTRMQPYTRNIFLEKDDPLLHYIFDDNDRVEPEFYLPVVPMIMVNGVSTAIGTGFSCSIPPYNVEEVVRYTRAWVSNKEGKVEEWKPEWVDDMTPYYKDYLGQIVKIDGTKFRSSGLLKDLGNGKYRVSELSIGMSTNKYKEYLEELVDMKKIKQLKNYSSASEVYFEFSIPSLSDFVPTVETMKLTSLIHLSNMVLFTKDFKLKKYQKLSEIFCTYCEERYTGYVQQKEWLLKTLKKELFVHEQKQQFLHLVLSKQLDLSKYLDTDIDGVLESTFGLKKSENSFQYLLSIQIHQLTRTRLDTLSKKILEIKKEIHRVQKLSPGDFWIEDLDTFQRTFQNI